ncbi:hypothetical protein RintRC_6615 [Richelia intracellularis]|nr:hypothetical protein RintRC_6615 [Richelia intracellularis]
MLLREHTILPRRSLVPYSQIRQADIFLILLVVVKAFILTNDLAPPM